MHVLNNLKGRVSTDALIGRLPIGARHSTKSHVTSGLCAERASERYQAMISSGRPWQQSIASHTLTLLTGLQNEHEIYGHILGEKPLHFVLSK
jgi:hypothetical protein